VKLLGQGFGQEKDAGGLATNSINGGARSSRRGRLELSFPKLVEGKRRGDQGSAHRVMGWPEKSLVEPDFGAAGGRRR